MEGLFCFFGVDGHLARGAPQNGANILGENKGFAFFDGTRSRVSER